MVDPVIIARVGRAVNAFVWLVVGGWWLVVGGRAVNAFVCLLVGGWWLVVGGRAVNAFVCLVVGGRWQGWRQGCLQQYNTKGQEAQAP